MWLYPLKNWYISPFTTNTEKNIVWSLTLKLLLYIISMVIKHMPSLLCCVLFLFSLKAYIYIKGSEFYVIFYLKNSLNKCVERDHDCWDVLNPWNHFMLKKMRCSKTHGIILCLKLDLSDPFSSWLVWNTVGYLNRDYQWRPHYFYHLIWQ